MGTIRTNAAAAILGVSANTLRSWEQRYGHPLPRRTDGGHRIFELTEIEALRDALLQTGEIGTAIAIARERGEGPSTPQRLALAFAEFNEEKADRLLEESLLVRSLERTVESVLLAAVQLLAEDTPECCFALRYATGWLAAANRVTPPATSRDGVMIFDGSSPASIDSLQIQTLELMLRRAGARTLSLPLDMRIERVGNALRALRPVAVVLAGAGAGLRPLAQCVHTARQVCGEVQIYDFRGAVPDTGASTVTRLGSSPMTAAEVLRSELIARPAARHACADESKQAATAAVRRALSNH